ncbi:MAG: Mur ligase family protein, partial [Candidatus Binatia bacterium]
MREKMTPGELAGQKVTVVGLGMEGVDLVRYLAARGADITVSDARPAEKLTSSLNQLAGIRMHLSLGENRSDAMSKADAVYVSQGVSLDLPAIAEARVRGTPIGSMMQIFLRECRGNVVGITGSSGKSTVTALLGEIFQGARRHTFVGGNIGVPLLSNLESIDEQTSVVLEISHTQLLLTQDSPHVAGITNVTPNHLDRFDWERYVDLKRNILRYQTAADIAVLNADDSVARGFASDTAARKVLTSLTAAQPGETVFLQGREALARIDASED